METSQARDGAEAWMERAKFASLDMEICEDQVKVEMVGRNIDETRSIGEKVTRLEELTDRIVQLERGHSYRRRRRYSAGAAE